VPPGGIEYRRRSSVTSIIALPAAVCTGDGIAPGQDQGRGGSERLRGKPSDIQLTLKMIEIAVGALIDSAVLRCIFCIDLTFSFWSE
jgi:hypothetical protein